MLNYLSKNPRRNIVIALLYYLLVVLPHEVVGRLIAAIFEDLTRDDYNLVILILSLISLTAFCFWLWKQVKKNPQNNKQVLFYLLVTVILSVITFKILIIVNVEVIHFFQYAMMALLLFPLIKRYGETLFWVTLLGAIDEAHQYFVLAPDQTNYYDFNDIIINLLGGAFGLILVKSLLPKFALPPRRPFYKSPVLLSTLALSLLVFVALKMEWLYVYPPDKEVNPLKLLIKVPQEGFWTVVHPNVTFHVVQPLEGLIIIGLLLLFYSWLGNCKVGEQRQT